MSYAYTRNKCDTDPSGKYGIKCRKNFRAGTYVGGRGRGKGEEGDGQFKKSSTQ